MSYGPERKSLLARAVLSAAERFARRFDILRNSVTARRSSISKTGTVWAGGNHWKRVERSAPPAPPKPTRSRERGKREGVEDPRQIANWRRSKVG